jgi:alpha-mannosidase
MLVFTEEKIAKLLVDVKASIYRESHDVPQFKYVEADPPGAQGIDFDDSGWADFHVLDYWGGYDKIAWFRTTVPIPAHLMDKKLSLRFLVGAGNNWASAAETMLYINGDPLQALDVWHEEAWLPEAIQGGSVYVALRAWSGVLNVPDRRRFTVAQLNWIDEGTEAYYFLAVNLLKSVKVLNETEWRRVKILEALNESVHRINFTQVRSDEYYATIQDAYEYLQKALTDLHQIENPDYKPHVTAVGHSHIDLAWLWRWKHTREKAGRTFATVLHLMRQYPEYRFMHSSPALYQAVSQDYPEIFEQIKAKIASGEWEITGGMWVESDTNMPNGESLIRQILYGKRYMRETFGQETTVLWLPDVFGYNWALPQIIVKSGLKAFVTTKISWSQFNRFPHNTFYWRGIDGTEVLTHFITAPEVGAVKRYTYNGTFEPSEVHGLWEQYRDKRINDQLLLAFGWGDGGGGPTRDMLESARVLKNLPGFPAVEIGKVEPFIASLNERVQGKDVPVWDGELYLEYHRGTYTSQAANKRANRKSEILYHNAEVLSALADVLLGENQYPDLREGWELILLNQFHDILPGSSIHPVYEDSAKDYERIAEIGTAALDAAVRRINENVETETDSLIVFNTLSEYRKSMVKVPYTTELAGKVFTTPETEDSKPLLSQVVEEDGQPMLLLYTGYTIPALGYQVFQASASAESPPVENSILVSPDALENEYYRLELNPNGHLTSIYDKDTQREVLAAGARGNVLQAFEDRPMDFNAWDIDLYYQEKMQEVTDLVEAVVEETGPVRGTLRLTWRFYASTITQRISIYAHTSRIDFRTEIDWHEQQVLLKAAFPVNIRATQATYDIQFGSIQRPTHWNTSWDYARFEVPMQKWMDLSEGNYGVAVLNDCKYGGDVKDNVMRLTLLKSAIDPDPLADKTYHVFTYSLYPHSGSLAQSGVISEAYRLNYPLIGATIPAEQSGELSDHHALATVFPHGRLILETVKQAEDGDGWIVRVYETFHDRLKTGKISFSKPVRRAIECNLVEEGEQPVDVQDNAILFQIAPFEIKTFRVWFE